MKDQLKGITCITIATVGFSFMTFFVRLAGDIPTMQKVFFRNAFALIIAIITLIAKKERFEIRKEFASDILFRCLFGTTGVIANFYAIDRLALADANMLNKLSPFFAILISIPILKEKPSGTDIFNPSIFYLACKVTNLLFGFIKQMKPSNKSIYFFIRECSLHFINNIGSTTMRT